MGQDTYINATIYEKATGRMISEKEFTVIWSCHNTARVMAREWGKLLGKYTDTSRLAEECRVEFPQTALREMASCLFSYAVLSERARFPMLSEELVGFWQQENRGKADMPYKEKPDWFSAERWEAEKADIYCFWDDVQSDEQEFFYKACRLREFIYMLDQIHFENKYEPLRSYGGDGLYVDGKLLFPDSFIPDANDLKRFRENPQAYEWKFCLWDSAG